MRTERRLRLQEALLAELLQTPGLLGLPLRSCVLDRTGSAGVGLHVVMTCRPEHVQEHWDDVQRRWVRLAAPLPPLW